MINLNEVSSEDANTALEYSNLKAAQKQKYDYLFPIYEDEAVTVRLVSLLDARGKNSFENVYEKITNLISEKGVEKRYHDTLSHSFTNGKVYSSSDIIGIVAEVRRSLGLAPYLSRLKASCESDFFDLFIAKDVFAEVEENDELKRKHIGYKPMFKLKPID